MWCGGVGGVYLSSIAAAACSLSRVTDTIMLSLISPREIVMGSRMSLLRVLLGG